MDTSKKYIKIWWVEDDDDLFNYLIDDRLKELDLSKLKIKHFKTAMELNNAIGQPDIIILDVAGIKGSQYKPYYQAWWEYVRIISKMIDNHPNAVYGLYSLVGYWAIDMLECVKKDIQDTSIVEVIKYTEFTFYDDEEINTFANFIKKYKMIRKKNG